MSGLFNCKLITLLPLSSLFGFKPSFGHGGCAAPIVKSIPKLETVYSSSSTHQQRQTTMSYPATSSAVGGAKPYFCHQCQRTVTITSALMDDPLCPLCNGGFLEEEENTNPTLNPFPSPFPEFFSPFTSLLPSLFALPASDIESPLLSNDFDPRIFLQNHLQGLTSSGARIELLIGNTPMDQEFGLPANLGDYFMGAGLEQLIQQLAENDPNRYGTPPASKSAVQSLLTVNVTEEILNSEMNQCAVCMDDFVRGADAKQMPCKHLFHKDCILPWLELHSSCPVCRYELPTDNNDSISSGVGDSQPQLSSSGSGRGHGNDGDGSQGGSGRSFSISFPWSFFGSSSDGGAN